MGYITSEMKVYVTKYALTDGIVEAEGTLLEDEQNFRGPKAIRIRRYAKQGTLFVLYGEGRDWHKTRESAVARANTMRDRKLVSLRKQIKKLEAMSF